MALLIATYSVALYALTVPLVTDATYQMEQDSGKSLLASVQMMVDEAYQDLERHRTYALETRKQELRDILSIVSAFMDKTRAEVLAGRMDPDAARAMVIDYLRVFTFGDNDYIWAADYDSVLISHPDPTFDQTDVSTRRDSKGRLVMPPMVEIARRDGEGYYTYGWSRLGEQEEREKISFFRDFPEWQIIVGAGLYLDDIGEAVRQRKAELTQDLRSTLRGVKIAKTGYMFVFNSDYEMIIHPNPNIEETQFGDLVNPLTDASIAEELAQVAGSDEPLVYQWDIPTDPGNYTYDKLSWVRHAQGFDWYIASSVYVDELKRGADAISDTILTTTLAVTFGALLLAFVLARRITDPVRALARAAAKIRGGDLSASSGIRRDDEVGELADAFDGMIEQLRDNFGALDEKVKIRTQDLEAAVEADRAARRALSAIEHRQRLILDAMPARIAYLDRDWRYRFANRVYAEHFGYDKADLIGLKVSEVLPPQAYQEAKPYLQAASQGQRVTFELLYAGPDGTPNPHKVTVIPETGHDGGLLVSSIDMTEERETERRLVGAQRMQAVGALAGGLAHDFNNLLTVILGNLSEAKRLYGETPGLPDRLDPAMRASRRGAAITGRLLAFARRQTLHPRPVDVAALLSETVTLLQGSLPKSLEIQVDTGPYPCWATVDSTALETAIINMALNARDAMPEGGLLTLRCRPCLLNEPLEMDEPVPAGPYAKITVQDTGQGFTEDTRRRAFEPFFTTKRAGSHSHGEGSHGEGSHGDQGSGLGLSMVYGFVKQSDGYLKLDSAPGEGAAFTLLLPAADEDPTQRAPSLLSERHGADEDWEGCLALLVEDEDDVRAVVRSQLQGLGFAVVEASTGEEAVELLAALDQVRLVVTDIVMPGSIDGYALARMVAADAPEARLVMMTGYTASDPAGPVLRKPFDRSDLAKAIREAGGLSPQQNQATTETPEQTEETV